MLRASATMWVLTPAAFAGKLLSVFRQPLSSLWRSLVPLFCWLRATWLLASKRTKQQLVWREPDETKEEEEDPPLSTTPTSVNYHFTRQCNYKCGFCFHTAKTSFVLPLEEAKRGLLLLKEAGESMVPDRNQDSQPFGSRVRREGAGGTHKLVSFSKTQGHHLPSHGEHVVLGENNSVNFGVGT